MAPLPFYWLVSTFRLVSLNSAGFTLSTPVDPRNKVTIFVLLMSYPNNPVVKYLVAPVAKHL